MYRIRSIIKGLKNLWKWRKPIYNDCNWDYWFIYQILKTKLEFTADHLEKHGIHENKDKDIAQIREVIRLIDIVQNEKIAEEAINSDTGWTKDTFKDVDKKHNAAKKELFKKLHDGIDHWWD